MNRKQILAAVITSIALVDVYIAIDKSGSMKSMMGDPTVKTDNPPMITRLDAVKKALKPQITQAVAYDQDGVDACTFNDAMHDKTNLNLENFDGWFNSIQAGSGTYLGPIIEQIGEQMLAKLALTGKRQCLFIYTDGAPGDKKATENALIKISNDPRIKEDGMVGITFIRIGQADGVAEFLTDLDTTLKANRDITSWTTLENVAELSHETICGYCCGGSFDPALYTDATEAAPAASAA